MEILIRVLLFQKLISFHNNMFPGCVLREMFHIFFSLLFPEKMNWSVFQGRLRTWRVKDAEWDRWRNISLYWLGISTWAKAKRGPAYRKLFSPSWDCVKGRRTTTTLHGFTCRVTVEWLKMFPNKPFSFYSNAFILPWPCKHSCNYLNYVVICLVWLSLQYWIRISPSNLVEIKSRNTSH